MITRRKHLDLLRAKGLYERLGGAERDLLLLPDGHWTEETISDVTMLLEPLRLLRWALRIDRFLPAVGSDLRAEFRLATDLVSQPDLVSATKQCLTIDDLRVGLSSAEHFFHRTWTEGVRRSLYLVADNEQAAKMKAFAERLQGRENEDLLIGATIVSAAGDEEIRLATTLALRRAQVLRWLRGRIYGEVPRSGRLERLIR